jgi:hypothetical protein
VHSDKISRPPPDHSSLSVVFAAGVSVACEARAAAACASNAPARVKAASFKAVRVPPRRFMKRCPRLLPVAWVFRLVTPVIRSLVSSSAAVSVSQPSLSRRNGTCAPPMHTIARPTPPAGSSPCKHGWLTQLMQGEYGRIRVRTCRTRVKYPVVGALSAHRSPPRLPLGTVRGQNPCPVLQGRRCRGESLALHWQPRLILGAGDGRTLRSPDPPLDVRERFETGSGQKVS